MQGIFELKTPSDLLKKLEHDLARIEANLLDSYAAFDFFVTAEHMLDWVYPNDKEARRQERDSRVELRICSNIANGSKHFEATAKQHDTVSDTRIHKGRFSNAFSSGFVTSRLMISLKGDADQTLGSEISVIAMANKVLAYWKGRLP